MFCTDDERNSCQAEKMGCDNCYYNLDDSRLAKEIEELKSQIKTLTKERDYYKKMYLDSNNFFLRKDVE